MLRKESHDKGTLSYRGIRRRSRLHRSSKSRRNRTRRNSHKSGGKTLRFRGGDMDNLYRAAAAPLQTKEMNDFVPVEQYNDDEKRISGNLTHMGYDHELLTSGGFVVTVIKDMPLITIDRVLDKRSGGMILKYIGTGEPIPILDALKVLVTFQQDCYEKNKPVLFDSLLYQPDFYAFPVPKKPRTLTARIKGIIK